MEDERVGLAYDDDDSARKRTARRRRRRRRPEEEERRSSSSSSSSTTTTTVSIFALQRLLPVFALLLAARVSIPAVRSLQSSSSSSCCRCRRLQNQRQYDGTATRRRNDGTILIRQRSFVDDAEQRRRAPGVSSIVALRAAASFAHRGSSSSSSNYRRNDDASSNAGEATFLSDRSGDAGGDAVGGGGGRMKLRRRRGGNGQPQQTQQQQYPSREVLLKNLQSQRSQVLQLLERKRRSGRIRQSSNATAFEGIEDVGSTTSPFEGAFLVLREMFALAEISYVHNNNTIVDGNFDCKDEGVDEDDGTLPVQRLLDRTVQAYAEAAFFFDDGEYDGEYVDDDCGGAQRVQLLYWATRALQLQWSSPALRFPYNAVPKRTVLAALKAWTALAPKAVETATRSGDVGGNFLADDPNGVTLRQPLMFGEYRRMDNTTTTTASSSATPTTIAFRLLQRLVTGEGVRTRARTIHEQDFCRVLNAAADAGEMDLAHRIVALQERTPHAPPVSAVAYSILIKGYGKLADLRHVEQVLEQARRNGIVADTVMVNSAIDVFVSCNALSRAMRVFRVMKRQDGKALEQETDPMFGERVPKPNGRTYNTILKGLAQEGKLQEALDLAYREMDSRFWDSVTTNTLVHAAVIAKDFQRAEQLLNEHTVENGHGQQRKQQHPNVEAYTELLDAYAKNHQLDKAIAVFQLMRQREVEPNEITYTCLLGGFGRSRRPHQARKMIKHMTTAGRILPSCIAYNALVSGLLESTQIKADMSLDARVDESLRLLREMIKSGIRPNAITISTIVYAMGQCSTPRVEEAKSLVNKLQRSGYIPSGDPKVVTALVRTCGAGQDVIGVLEAFRSLGNADVVAINSFLDVCCRIGRDRLAHETFEHYFRRKNGRVESAKLKPDVISYSVLISALLKKSSSDSVQRAHSLYKQMKSEDNVVPDIVLVDIVLKAFVHATRTRSLGNREVYFLANVLRDAEQLNWPDGQLERRKRTVRVLLGDKLREVWKNDKDLYGLLSEGNVDSEDDLFKRKGWNEVDSGFRLWGTRSASPSSQPFSRKAKSEKVVDEFLESKGWNDVDSGFRIW